jgi:hypothetical protein
MFTAPAKKKPGTSPEQPSAPAKSKRAKEIDYRQELAILWAKIAPLEKKQIHRLTIRCKGFTAGEDAGNAHDCSSNRPSTKANSKSSRALQCS